MPPERFSLRARWILPVDGAPIENGTIAIGRGRIAGLSPAADPRALDLGNAAIIPGLVNAHTHLEFSGLPRPVDPPRPFTVWLRGVVANRRGRSTNVSADLPAGLQECLATGTTTCGEISTAELPPEFPPEAAPRLVSFRELIGLLPEQADAQVAIARAHLEELNATGRNDVLAGISPHAPYSVSQELLARLVELADEFNAPVAMHLAETREELEFLDRGTGDFRQMTMQFGVWREGLVPAGARPLDYLRLLDRLSHVLVIHGNYLSPEEIRYVSERPHFAVVYCPRTHAFFGHEPHPWRMLLEQGALVALGTDSRASNPDLSLWSELLFLRARFSGVSPRTLLQMGTLNGARALGIDDETGSLSIGKGADLAVVPLQADAGSDPYSVLFEAGTRVSRVMRGGAWVDAGGAISG